MKKAIQFFTFLLLSTSTLFSESYSPYKIVASKRMNACYPANNFKGRDISPNKLLANYPCEIKNKNDSLGAIFIYCDETPYGGKGAFLFIRNQRDCSDALEALSQM